MIEKSYFREFGKRTALHISDECMSIFGISLIFPKHSVYANRLNSAILRLQQSGFIAKLYDEMVWDTNKMSQHNLLKQQSISKLQSSDIEERGLTLADTEGMFLLMGIGYLFAGSVLISEIIGGCANKCRKIARRVSTQMSSRARSSYRASSRASLAMINEAESRLSSSRASLAMINDAESHKSSSSSSFEITQQMLRRKSAQEFSFNPFKGLYNRHRRHHSLVSSRDDHIWSASILSLKRSSLNGLTEEKLSDGLPINEEIICHNIVTTVEINRPPTPFHNIEDTFGEEVIDLS